MGKLNPDEQIVADRVTLKLQNEFEYDAFAKKVFTAIRTTGFKRLSFLSDLMEDWDLSHLTGYPAILAESGLNLFRKTDEIQLYEDLFKQLDKNHLIEFLANAVAGEELPESAINDMMF